MGSARGPLWRAMPFPTLNLQDARDVVSALRRGAEANKAAACRRGAIDRIEPPGVLIATGDLHDNPVHLNKLIRASGLDGEPPSPVRHLVLHEVVHADRLINGMDFSYRALTRVAALKAEHPELVHVLLANHELSQVVGAGIVKDGVKPVECFNRGVEYVFGDEADEVDEAIREFVLSMPLALRCVCPVGDILVAHSLPPAAMMSRFDPTVLSRDLTPADYEPRRGSAHIMVWGRGYDPELLEDLVERWGVYLFVLGHEKCEEGVKFIPPCALVLNSDHEKGVYVPIDLERPPRPERAAELAVALRDAPE